MGKRVESSTGRGSVAPQTPPARLRIWLVGGGEGGGRKVIRLEGKERSMHRDVDLRRHAGRRAESGGGKEGENEGMQGRKTSGKVKGIYQFTSSDHGNLHANELVGLAEGEQEALQLDFEG